MISVLNWKEYRKGSMLGFFDLRYHGLVIKGCRLMESKNGGPPWFVLPQKETEGKNGERVFFDLMYFTPPERQHIQTLIVSELRKNPENDQKSDHQRAHQTPEGEDLGEYYSNLEEDNPF